MERYGQQRGRAEVYMCVEEEGRRRQENPYGEKRANVMALQTLFVVFTPGTI